MSLHISGQQLGLEFELYRLYTFRDPNWNPAPGKPSACTLARIGFYYSDTHNVVCYKCLVLIDCCDLGEAPEDKHRRSSPNCPLVRGTATDNVTLVAPLSVISRFKTDASLTDVELDAPSHETDTVSCISLSSFRKLYQILESALRRSSARSGAGSTQLDLSLITVDRNNPNFDHLRHEQVRLSTFNNWPPLANANPTALARAGFFYSGTEDRVKCAFCRGILRNWTHGDVPDEEHRKHFPDCPFVRGIDVGNVSVDPVAQHLHVSEIDQQSAVVQSQPAMVCAPAAEAVAARTLETAPQTVDALVTQASAQRPKHPNYAKESARIDSFRGKTLPRGQDIKVMASAGFFHVGPHDNVKCFWCDGGLKNWQPNDDPWEEHAKWFPRCAYLVTQRDPSYIQMIQDAYRPDLGMQGNLPANIGSTPLALPVAVPAETVHYSFEPREIKARMDSPMVKVVLGIGFPRELVRHAIQVQLATTGDDFPSAQDLVDAVMRLQEQQEQGTLGVFIPPQSSSASASINANRYSLASSHSASTTVPAVSASFPVVPEIKSNQQHMSCDAGRSSGGETQLLLPAGRAASSAAEKDSNIEAQSKSATSAKSAKSKRRNKKKKTKSNRGDADVTLDDESAADEEKDADLKQQEQPSVATSFEDPGAKSLLEENRQLKEAKTCKICMDKDVNIVFLPCGHLACCDDCAPALRTCPICRAFIRGTVRIFLS